MTQDKALYINLCRTEDSIPLFMKEEWLDVVVMEGESWQVVLVDDGKGRIVGAMTFVMKKKWGLTILSEPLFTPPCGIWLMPMSQHKQHEQYHFVKKTLTELIHQLPPFHFAHFRFSTALTDWQPFYWAGFKQTTRYTYQLDLTKEDNLFANFKHNTQRNIKKAERHFQITTTNDLDKLLTVNDLTFERQNMKSPIPDSVWQRVDAFLNKTEQRTIYLAQNTDGTSRDSREGGIEAAVYIVFDKKTAYYLAGGTSEKGRNLGATPFLLYHAIKEAQSRGMEVFDFEGSMLHGVEAFFRSFNPELKPYFSVWKYRNRFLSFVDALRKL